MAISRRKQKNIEKLDFIKIETSLINRVHKLKNQDMTGRKYPLHIYNIPKYIQDIERIIAP
jgi:hypothetical protein